MSAALTDSYGAPIPEVDVSAARGSALHLRRAGVAGDACLDLLAAAVAPGWSGVASQGYLDGRAAVSRQATDVAEACGVLSRAIVEFGDEAGVVLPRWRDCARRLADLELTVSDPARAGLDVAALGMPGLDALVADRDALRVEVAACERRFGDAQLALVSAANYVTASLDDGVLSTYDQLWAIPETMMQALIVEPAGLLDLLVDDPSQVDDVAKAMWSGLVEQVTHPVRTAQEISGSQAYAEGRWGEGIGTGLATIAGVIGTKGLRPPDADQVMSVPAANRFRRNVQSYDVPVPKTQTMDEMAAGVDLDRSEHATLGHVLSRHVDADEEYLRYRLMVGTPLPEGRLDPRPPAASVWADRATAEATITQAIRDNRAELDKWWGDGQGKALARGGRRRPWVRDAARGRRPLARGGRQ